MNSTNTGTKSYPGITQRKDVWWLEPALIALGFGIFIVYATWRAFENRFYEFDAYLSPFYSPPILKWAHSIGLDLSWLPISPAVLILWIPAGFRATCYYYRKAYYRAYFMDPPACGVGHSGLGLRCGEKYCGETAFPLIVQNIHRYMFYLAAVVLAILWWDALTSFFPPGHFVISLVSLVMVANVVLLSGYTFGCHAYRHLVGGGLDCFSAPSARNRYKMWQFVTSLNEHHMAWAWASLFSVGFTDFFIRQVSAGTFPDIRFLSI